MYEAYTFLYMQYTSIKRFSLKIKKKSLLYMDTEIGKMLIMSGGSQSILS